MTTVRESAVVIFGEELRRAREQRGLAIDTICQNTKVSAKHIRALEAGDLGELPGGVFRRGFLRSYIRAVGLDEVSWMKRFDETCRASGMRDPSGMEWSTFAENVKNNRVVLGYSAGRRRAGLALTLVLLGLAAWLGWRLATHRRLLPTPLILISANSWVDNASSR